MEESFRESIFAGQGSNFRVLPVGSILQTNARLWMGSVLLATDMLSLLAAIVLARLIRLPGISLDPYYQEIFILLALTLAVAFSRKELYPAVGMNYVDELREIVSSTSFAFLILIGVTFLLKTTSVYSRLVLLLTWAICLGAIPAGRYAVRKLFIHLNLWGEPVVIIGDLHGNLELADYFTKNLQLGLRPVAILRDRFFSDRLPESGPALTMAQIRQYAQGLSSSTALVVITDLNNLDVLIDRYRAAFQRVILIKGRNGSYSLNSLKSLDLSDILGLQVMNNLLSFWAQLFKRMTDVLISALGLLILAPFFALTAVLIKLTSASRPYGVFYRQLCIGRGGNTFNMLKFRTMHPNAGAVLDEMLRGDPEARREWDTYQKLRNDPRITSVGRLLRKFSLDELPQLWNVLAGEMSLVGPRPMLPNQQQCYGESFKEYIQVSPGMTGLWQVSGRNQTTFARRAELDREYIQRWSAWLDIFIMVKTIKIVFWHEGAY